ncbi:MAG: glycosyltransferase family 39 protein [Bacteroidales bacterium]|nr:glycosyltransferase family 39 protein [Bacteroidales bacterium]
MLRSLYTMFRVRWERNPLIIILILAFIIRFISVIFSQGYGMHDDHFLAVETPWSWTVGEDYEGWLPESQEAGKKMEAQNIAYPSINYLQFAFLKMIGIDNPKIKMFFLRLLLALFSLVAVKYAYQIAEKLADKKTAIAVGLMLALFWFMPFLSVRNLVEIVAVPFLFWGSWLYIKLDDRVEFTWQRTENVFFAGFIIAIAMAIRYQVGIFLIGMGLALLIQRKWMDTLLFGVGAIVALLLTHGLTDLILWGEPFIQMKEYVVYNISHKGLYGNQENVLMYIEIILGLLIPPVSIFIFFGFFRIWKKHLLLFLPNFLFLAFHTYFPNRQERFIFTIIPMVIMLGMIGWNEFVGQSGFWKKRPAFLRNIYRFFWITNILLLIPVSLTYSKKSRVEAMAYFYPIKEQVNTVLVDDTGRRGAMMMPVLYAGKPLKVITLPEDNPEDTTNYSLIRYQFVVYSMHVFDQDNGIDWPEYIIFVEDIDLEKRVEYMKNYFPDLEREAYIQPSLGDRIMKRLNPANKNEEFFIYKTNFKS